MEDDAVTASRRWFPRAVLAVTLLLGVSASSAYAAPRPSGVVLLPQSAVPLAKGALSPLPLFLGRGASTAMGIPQGQPTANQQSNPTAQTSLPPLPLLAQAAQVTTTQNPEEAQRFATPAPGQVIDEDEEESEEEKQKKRDLAKKPKPECDSDGQCPDKTICVQQSCKSIQRPLSAILYFHRLGPIGYRMVLPFYYSFWHPDKKTRVLFPLFADHQNLKEKTRDVWVFPTYQYHREPGMRAHRIWPLFFYQSYGANGEQGKAVGLLPLFWVTKKTDSTTVVLPPLLFFHHHNVEEKRTDTGFLPLLLFVRKQPDLSQAFFLALGFYRRTPERTVGGFLPLVFHSRTAEKRHTLVLPLFYDGENYQNGSRTSTLFPLFLYHRGADKSRLIVTPLGGSYKNPDEESSTTVWLAPPAFHRDDPLRRFTTVLPPLAMWYRNKTTGSSWGYAGPFFYTRDEEGGSEGLVPLYFHFSSRQQKSDTRVLVPLLAALHTSPQRKFGFLGPIYGWSSQTGSGGGLLPLISVARGQNPHVAILPPLFVYSADKEKGSYHVSVGPVFARVTTRGEDAGYTAGVFPLLWFHRRGGSSTQALFPILYHNRRPYQETLQLGPFYYFRKCPEYIGDKRAEVRAGLVPLLFWKRSPERSYTVLFPLIWQVRTPQKSALVVGPFFHTTEKIAQGEVSTTGLLPLFYVSRSPKSTFAIAPLFAYRSTPERKTFWLGPYVEHASGLGTREQTVTRAFLPLFFSYCGPGRRASVLFPLFMNVQDKDTTFRQIALLYYGVKTPERTAHVLLPLFFHVRDRERTTTVLMPFFYSKNQKTEAVSAGLLPLFAFGKSKETTWATTPLGFFYRDQKATRAAALLFYADIRKDREDFGIFPLWFYTRRDTAHAVFVLPFFYHSHDSARSKSLTVLGPLFFGRRGQGTYGGFLPLFYGANDGDGSYRFMALPLMYFSHRGGKAPEDWLVTPLFGVNKNPVGSRFWIGPLYIRRQDPVTSAALFPLFYYTRDDKAKTSTSFVLPLWLQTRSPERSVTMVTPLFWHERTLMRRISVLFPLVLDVHHLHSDRLTAVGPLVPLVVRYADYAAKTTSWVFPPILTYVKRRADGYHNAVVFPLLWHFGGKDRSTTVLFPLFYHVRRPATQFTALLPFFAYSRDEHGTRSLLLPPLLTWVRNYENGSRDRVVFPFLWHFKRPKQTTTVFFPIGAHWSNEKGHYTLVLNSYYYKGTGERAGAYRFEFWPLFHVGRPRAGDLEWSILSGFLGYSRDGIRRTLRLLWGVFIPLEPVGAQTTWYGASWRMASDR